MEKLNIALPRFDFRIALWFAIVTGFVEGLGLFVLASNHLLKGTITYLGYSIEILWLSIFFDILLFGMVGVFWELIQKLPLRLISKRIVPFSVFTFTLMTVFDWVEIVGSGRLRIAATAILAVGVAVQATFFILRRYSKFTRLVRVSLPYLAAASILLFVLIQTGLWVSEKMQAADLPEANPKSPNVLVIVIDSLRADHLSSYEYSRPTSPNVDAIAEDGIVFENAYSTASWTLPSHAAMLTGRFTYEHKAELQALDGRYPAIGEELQELGYRTGGFSGNFGIFNRSAGLGRGFIHFEDHYTSLRNYMVETVYGRMIHYYVLHKAFGLKYTLDRKLAVDVNEAALRWINKDRDKPFFVFINYGDVHSPYTPPQPYWGMFSDLDRPGGRTNTDWGSDGIYVLDSQEQIQEELDAYDGSIAYVDAQIKSLLVQLEKQGLLQNTLVVITSDHGEAFGEHGLLQHANSLYKQEIHVPLIMYAPAYLDSGLRVETPVSLASLPATIMEIVNPGIVSPIPGPSLTLLWDSSFSDENWPLPISELAKIETFPIQAPSSQGSSKTVIDTGWQYLTHEKLGEELYNLENDPEETQNLVEGNADILILNRLRDYLNQKTK